MLACVNCGVGLVVNTCSTCVQPEAQAGTLLGICAQQHVSREQLHYVAITV